MKQYTTPGQTAKLIELGFENPKSIAEMKTDNTTRKITTSYGDLIFGPFNIARVAYSIGELMEMLPTKIKGVFLKIDKVGQISWAVSYEPTELCCGRAELIDALYDMVVKLKEEGVI